MNKLLDDCDSIPLDPKTFYCQTFGDFIKEEIENLQKAKDLKDKLLHKTAISAFSSYYIDGNC
jgi:hypothetical protein